MRGMHTFHRRPGCETVGYRALTPLEMARRGLGREQRASAIVAIAIATCVFVQCIFSGVAGGLREDARTLEDSDDIAGVFEGWNKAVSLTSMLLMALTMGGAVAMSIFEGRRSLAVLRSIGLRRGQVASIALGEPLLVVAISYCAGIAPGLAIGGLLDHNFSLTGSVSPVSLPFSAGPWMLLPLPVLAATVLVVGLSGLGLLFSRQLVEVLNYE